MFFKNLGSVFFSGLFAFILSLLLNHYSHLVSKHYQYSIMYFSIVCFVLNTIYAVKSKSKTFTELLLAGLVIKFLLAFIVIIIYSIIDKPNFFYFSIHFISHYILFTIFEIRYLLQLIKINQSKNTLHEK